MPSPLLLYIEGELDSKYHTCNDIGVASDCSGLEIEGDDDNRIDADTEFCDFSLNNF